MEIEILTRTKMFRKHIFLAMLFLIVLTSSKAFHETDNEEHAMNRHQVRGFGYLQQFPVKQRTHSKVSDNI